MDEYALEFRKAVNVGMKHGFPVYGLGRGDTPPQLVKLENYVLIPVGPKSTLGPLSPRIAQILYSEQVQIKGMAVLWNQKHPSAFYCEPFETWKKNAQWNLAHHDWDITTPVYHTLVAVLSDWVWAGIDQW